MERTLSLKTRQTLALSPRLQQSVRLLQLSALEFAQEIRQALVSNPFLEEEDTEDPQAPGIAGTHDEPAAADAPPEEPSPSASDRFFRRVGPPIPAKLRAGDHRRRLNARNCRP